MSQMKTLVESMISRHLQEDAAQELDQMLEDAESVLNKIKDDLKRQYGFEASVGKSALGGKNRTTFFLKVFGPKETWTNNIALNSPVAMTISIGINPKEIEMIQNSYQMRDAKAKMRKAKYTSVGDLEKKISDYFKKNNNILTSLLKKD
jgi:hypothetical protein